MRDMNGPVYDSGLCPTAILISKSMELYSLEEI
jgi:hypothetical protein